MPVRDDKLFKNVKGLDLGSMTFLSLTPSVDIAKCKVSMLKLLKLYLYIFREEGKCLRFILETYKQLQNKGKTEELET
jgi:hypothetical protein